MSQKVKKVQENGNIGRICANEKKKLMENHNHAQTDKQKISRSSSITTV